MNSMAESVAADENATAVSVSTSRKPKTRSWYWRSASAADDRSHHHAHASECGLPTSESTFSTVAPELSFVSCTAVVGKFASNAQICHVVGIETSGNAK